jgi:hypothetical protein
MTKFTTTADRRANLVKLARFLMTDPVEPRLFHMGSYQWGTCDSPGCAIGWAPTAGIPTLAGEDWSDYSDRALVDFDENKHRNFWWCFEGGWVDVDNSPRGAGKRILWMLLHGTPDNYEQQVAGDAPLCYADWQPTESDWAAAEINQ